MHIEFYSTWMLVLQILRVMSSATCLEKILIVGSIELCVHTVAIETNLDQSEEFCGKATKFRLLKASVTYNNGV
jgi:hypothetical protein